MQQRYLCQNEATGVHVFYTDEPIEQATARVPTCPHCGAIVQEAPESLPGKQEADQYRLAIVNAKKVIDENPHDLYEYAEIRGAVGILDEVLKIGPPGFGEGEWTADTESTTIPVDN